MPFDFSHWTQVRVYKAFQQTGRSVWQHGCRWLLASLLGVFMCAAGFTQLQMETRDDLLWVPQRSEVYKQNRASEDWFGDTMRTERLFVRSSLSGHNSLTPEITQAAVAMWHDATRIKATYNGDVLTFDDICFRAYDDGPCLSQVINSLAVWNFSQTITNQTVLLQRITHVLTNTSTDLKPWFGSLKYDHTGDIISAKSFIIPFHVKGATTEDSKRAIAWEEKFISHFRDRETGHYNGATVYVFAKRSFGDEIARLVVSDMGIFMGAILLMVAYLCVTLGSLHRVRARTWLGSVAVLVLLGSFLSAVGLIAWMADLNITVLLVPYVLIGVGVDDIIIIVDMLNRAPRTQSPPHASDKQQARRLGSAFGQAGTTITLTSITAVAAFAVGSAIDMQGVRIFCAVACLAFFANFVLQFSVFGPFLAIDERRILRNDNFCCPCWRYRRVKQDDATDGKLQGRCVVPFSKNTDAVEETTTVPVGEGRTVPSEIDDGPGSPLVIQLDDGTKIPMSALSPGVSTPKNFVLTSGRQQLSQLFVERVLMPCLSKRSVRIGIVLGTLLMVGLSGWAFTMLDTETTDRRLLPDDSYVHNTLDIMESDYSGELAGASYVVFGGDWDANVRDATTRNNLYAFAKALEQKSYIATSVQGWLWDFDWWLRTAKNDSLAAAAGDVRFIQLVAEFLGTGNYTFWKNDVELDRDTHPTKVVAFRLRTTSRTIDTTQSWDVRNDIVATLGNHNLKGYPQEYIFQFGYLNSIMRQLISETMAWAALGVAISLIPLLGLRMTVAVMLSVVLLDVTLFGWMYVMGVSLDVFAFLPLVMAVGVSVDYTVHIAHGFEAGSESIGRDAQASTPAIARLEASLTSLGSCVLKGAFTAFMGCALLAFSQSAAFRTFFVVFAGIILLALFYALAFLPAILTLAYEAAAHWQRASRQSSLKHSSSDRADSYTL